MLRNVVKQIIIIAIFCQPIFGQNTEIGIGIGGTNYWGDLEPESTEKNVFLISPAIQFSYKRSLIGNLGLRINAFLGKVEGDDRNSIGFFRRQRNLNFTSPIRELSLLIEYSLWDLNEPKKFYTPFIGVGAGVFTFNPKTEYTFEDGLTSIIELQPLGTEGQGLPGYAQKYSRTAYSIPVTGGIKFKYGDNIFVTLEIILRYTTTDYLDDVSTVYVPFDDFPPTAQGQLASYLSNRIDEYLNLPENDPAATIYPIRGSPAVNDFFHSGMMTIYFRLNSNGKRRRSKLDCFSF